MPWLSWLGSYPLRRKGRRVVEWPNDDGIGADLEDLVRQAGGYVRPSEDLRPRVLESAHSVCGEQRTRSRVSRLASFVLVLSGWTSTVGEAGTTSSAAAGFSRHVVDAEELFDSAQARAVVRGIEFDWGLVEVFSDLRDRQAETLRPLR